MFFYALWAYNFVGAWYGNIPEETLYFKQPYMGYYMTIGYTFTATAIIFLIAGIIYLLQTHVQKVIIYLLIVNMVISSYCVWISATAFNSWRSNSFLSFLNLALFAISIFQLTKPAPNAGKA
jgi:presenilin-like A22 family membrane protease